MKSSCTKFRLDAHLHCSQLLTLGSLAALVVSFWLCPVAVKADSHYAFPLGAQAVQSLKAELKRDRKRLKAAREHCRQRKVRERLGKCDADKDGLSNKREGLLGTNRFLKDSDFDGISDYDELLVHSSNPLQVDNLDGGCYPSYFDARGNTVQFGLPSEQVGNTGRGHRAYTKNCLACHGDTRPGTDLYAFDTLKTRLSLAPMFITSIKDKEIADLTAYLNQSKRGQGACEQGPSPVPSGTPFPCSNEFFDSSGNTTRFGIPTSFVGNLGRGAEYYRRQCSSCHLERGTKLSFTEIKAAVTGPLMRIASVSEQDYADLSAFLNRSSAPQNCASPVPTAQPSSSPTSSPSAMPSAVPTVTPPACSNQYFDQNGNTTQFGIPASLSGNMSQGASYYGLACSSCHGERGANFSFPQLKAAVTGPLMKITSLSDQQYAHLVAFLNRSMAPSNCTPAPSATPTPLDDISAGAIVFQTTCSSCHSKNWDELSTLSAKKLREAIKEVRKMQGITLSDEQMRVLLLYLHSL